MYKIISTIAISLCFISNLSSHTQSTYKSYLNDPTARPREHNTDMEKMILDVHFQPEKGIVIGKVTYDFTPIRSTIDSLYLDAPEIRLKKVSLDNADCGYTTSKEGMTLHFKQALVWGSKHSITIEYEATPKKGIYFIGWDDPKNVSRKQIWTQGEGVDNRYWIPAYDDADDKLITEEIVTIDKKYKVLGNGKKLEEKINADGTKTWHYAMSHPMAFYLVMLGIGEYEVATDKASDGTPLGMWYYEDKKEALEPTYRYTAKIMDFFEKETGVKFPWESYSQIPVQNFLYGAMENTTATIFGDFYYVDKREFLDRDYIGVNAHEMAHQWFGDFITGRGPNAIWLQESFATHYGKLANHYLRGEDYYQWDKRNEANTSLAMSKDNKNPIVNTSAGSGRIYQKGSFVLDMLKYVVGKDNYDRVVTHYLNAHAYSNVETYDFYVAFHDVLGLNLDWFFDEWLYRGGEPEYKVSFLQDPAHSVTLVNVDQVQERNEVTGLFKMPITVEVHYLDGNMTTQQDMVEEENHVFHIPNHGNRPIDYILFDPNSYILKKLTFDRPFAMLEGQALRAKNMIDRYDALVALKSFPMNQKKQTLLNAYSKETFHATKSEIIAQIINETDPVCRKIITEALHDKDVKVRLAALQNLQKIPAELIPDCENLLKDSSYKITETALTKLCQDNPSKTDQYLTATDKQYGPDHSLRLEWLKRKYLMEKEHAPKMQGTANASPEAVKAVKEIVLYASVSYEFRTRGAAIKTLQSLNYLDDDAMANVIDAYLSNNGRLSGPAGETISYFTKQDEYKKMLTDYAHSKTWSDWQKDKLSKIITL